LRASTGESAEASELRQRQAHLREELAAADAAVKQHAAESKPAAQSASGSWGGGGKKQPDSKQQQQRDRQQQDELREARDQLESELTQVEVDLQLLAALNNAPAAPPFPTKLRPLPPIWERGVSLAVLELFANELVASAAAPTASVVAALRVRLARSGRRTALVGLLADAGLRTTVRQRPRLVDDHGHE
jgi:hypothetical protein